MNQFYISSFLTKQKALKTLIIFLLSLNIAHAKIARDFKVGSGSKGAIFYPTAFNICEIYNKYTELPRKCQAETSNGAYRNLVNLQRSRIDLGISQSSLQYKHYNDEDDDLRTVTFLHNEYFTILVNDKINSFEDLLDKRVNLGNMGSGSYLYFKRIMEAKGWKNKEFEKVYLQPSSMIAKMFCDGQIDAAIYSVGHPNSIFDRAINECGGRILSLSKDEVAELTAILPEYIPANMTKKIYKKQPNDVKTIAVPIVLSASKDLDETIVYDLLNIVTKHREELVKAHPVFKQINFQLKPKTKTAPLHKGAEKFYNN